MMAVEQAPSDDELRDRLHAAEEGLSAEQLAQASASVPFCCRYIWLQLSFMGS